MKRKLFTLLAAFVALVAFQANAQTTAGGWYYIDTKSPTDVAVPGFTGTAFWGSIPDSELNGALRVAGLSAPFLNVKGSVGPFTGDFTRYFNIKKLGATATFTITSRSSNQDLKLTYGGVTIGNFEFVQFSGAVNGVAVNATAGGYVCMPTTTGWGGVADRVFVVVNQNTGTLSLMDRDEIDAANLDASTNSSLPYYSCLWAKATPYGGRWATYKDFQNTDFVKFQIGSQYLNANDNHSGKAFDVFRVSPVDVIVAKDNWVQDALFPGSGLKARWSTGSPADSLAGLYHFGNDFMLPLFTIRTADDSCKYLSVRKENKIYSSEQAVKTAYSDLLEIRNYAEYYYQPSNRSNWGYVKPGIDPQHPDPFSSSFANPNEIANAIKSQVWAIWIDMDGKMSIYPSYAYIYDPTTRHGGVPETAPNGNNQSLLHNQWQKAFDGTTMGYSYKIGQRIDGKYPEMNGVFCMVPPVENPGPTYKNGSFDPIDWNNYNSIPEGRFFFLETKAVGGFNLGTADSVHSMTKTNGKDITYVLSVQPVEDAGNLGTWYKKVVMVPKEKLRTNPYGGSKDNDYSTYALDSVIMSAHWMVAKVKDANGDILGYRFVNELGDTLKYSGDVGTFGASLSIPDTYTALSNGHTNSFWGDRGAVHFDHNSFPNWIHGVPIFTGPGYAPNSTIPFQMLYGGKYYDPTVNPLQDPWDLVGNKYFHLDTWKTVKSKNSTDDYFYLRLNNYENVPGLWAQSQVNLDTIGGTHPNTRPYNRIYESYWHEGDRVATMRNGQPEYYYWQRDVVARPFSTTSFADLGGSCTNGIALKMTPVTYSKDTILYKDASDPDYFFTDSLTAYLHKEGYYNVTEAVDLALNIGVTNGDIVSMVPTKLNNLQIEPVGYERDIITTFNTTTPINSGFGSFNTSDLRSDALYGDPYKWHYVSLRGEDGTVKYMVFDIINPNAPTPDLMYGFRFKKVDRLNATPIRFYQPLVGDKISQYFIIQFVVPKYYYAYDSRTNTLDYDKTEFYANHIGLHNATYYPGGDPDIKEGQVRFAKFNRQTGPLYITRDVKSKATRFYFTPQGEVCRQEFVDVEYLMDNGMYRLPITAEVYESGQPMDWFIANKTTSTPTVVDGVEKEAKANAAKLKFTLADTLHATIGTFPAALGSLNQPGIGNYRYALTAPANRPANEQSAWYRGYEPNSYSTAGTKPYETVRKDVHLFYIQNEQGYYLTVMDTTVASQNLDRTSNPDVYGGKLAFLPNKYSYTNQDYKDNKVDKRPLQMFAIHGCKTNEAPYGEFVFLPAASYMYDYKTSAPVMNQPQTNVEIGVYASAGYTTVTGAFRIANYGRGATPYLIVVPGNRDVNTTVTADEFKFTREGIYAGPFCHHNFVQNTSKDRIQTLNGNKFYGYYGADNLSYDYADRTNSIMHWTIDSVKGKQSLYTFAQELKQWRGQQVENQTLKDQYYMVQLDGSDYDANGKGQFEMFSRTNPKRLDTVEISCIDKTDFDLVCDDPKDEGAWKKCYDNYYRFCDETVINYDFGIIEALKNDRYIWDGKEAISDNNPRTEAAIGKQLVSGGSAEYLEIIKSWVRPVSEHHSIPYYNIVRRINDVPYYLEVTTDSVTNTPNGVRFRAVNQLELDTLANYEKYPNSLPGLKFCFPYQLDKNGDRMLVNNPVYKDREFHRVYIQTLDTGYVNSIMLKANILRFDFDSKSLDARKLDEPDILKIDYRDSTKLAATTWFFGDNGGADYEWVELAGVRNNGADTEGWLTGASNDKPGNMYVTASGNTPVNYGLLQVFSQAGDGKLTFEFEGDTVIGTYNPKPIWYYRVKDADGAYLTNALDKAITDANYRWSEDKPYAYFTGKIANAAANAPIEADAKYDQTFGLRHVPVYMQGAGGTEKQYFWVVSRVNYKDKVYGEYYYLSQINDRLVFSKADLKNPSKVLETAMMFQLGSVDNDGKYTDIDKVGDGTFKVYGIDGAVKVVNATGTIDLYTVDGRKFNTVTAGGTEQVIAAPRGVVIVKNGATVEKVIVK